VRVLEAYDEVPAVLRELRDRGLTLAICSNWDWDLEPAVAETGLDGWFDTLVSSAWAGARKPHPRIYDYLLDQTGLDPAEILFVGDTWGPDVVGPLAAGMTPAYLERDGHWPDVTRPDNTSDVEVVRLRDLRGLLPVLGAD
jgi:putative hydrolase of the HAD superfamily